eukprot:5622971-Amphidinium_carterae.1
MDPVQRHDEAHYMLCDRVRTICWHSCYSDACCSTCSQVHAVETHAALQYQPYTRLLEDLNYLRPMSLQQKALLNSSPKQLSL